MFKISSLKELIVKDKENIVINLNLAIIGTKLFNCFVRNCRSIPEFKIKYNWPWEYILICNHHFISLNDKFFINKSVSGDN